MKIIYQANDGAIFDNEFDCEEYEFKISLKGLDKIIISDMFGFHITAPVTSDDAYNQSYMIEIADQEAYETFQRIAEYYGFYEWKDITGFGKWRYKELDRFSGTWEQVASYSLD